MTEQEQIWHNCVAGDREAMSVLYRRYAPSLRRLAEGIVSDSELAADVVHDGFVIILTSLSSLRDPSRLEPWMKTVVRRLALRQQSAATRLRYVELDDSFPDQSTDVTDRVPDMPWEELSGIIDALPKGYRDVFRLSMLDGLSHEEIGNLLGISPKTSSSQLYRARTLLRRLITDRRMNMLILGGALVFVGGWLWRTFYMSQPTATSRGEIAGGKSPSSVRQRIDTEAGNRQQSYPPNLAVSVNRQPIEESDSGGTQSLPKDSIPERKEEEGVDSITSVPLPDRPDVPLVAEDRHDDSSMETPILLPPRPSASGWSIGANYEGAYGADDEGNRIGFMIGQGATNEDIPDTILYDIKDEVRHHIPFVAGLSFSFRFDSRWSVETGLRYTRLRSDSVSTCRYWNRTSRQTIHYIGIPVKVRYRLFTAGGFSAYCQAGFGVDFPLKGKRKGVTVETPDDEKPTRTEWQIPLHAPVQWSVEAGIGLEYRFAPHVSIFAEPSFRYWLNPGGDVVTVRQESPASFTIPLGIRFSW